MGEPWLGYWVRASKNYDCFIRSGINPDIKHQSFVDCHQLFSVTLSRISIQPGNKNVCPTCYIHINFSNSPTSLNMSFLKRAITLALLQNKTGFSENRIYHSSLSLLLWRMVRKKRKGKMKFWQRIKSDNQKMKADRLFPILGLITLVWTHFTHLSILWRMARKGGKGKIWTLLY